MGGGGEGLPDLSFGHSLLPSPFWSCDQSLHFSSAARGKGGGGGGARQRWGKKV